MEQTSMMELSYSTSNNAWFKPAGVTICNELKMQYRLCICYIKSLFLLFFMFVLLQNDNFFNVELPTCQVLETWSLLLKANDEKVGSSLALQVSESRLRRTHEIYSFDVRPFMWRTPGVSCSPAYERCPASAAERWEILTDIYRTPVWIPPEP